MSRSHLPLAQRVTGKRGRVIGHGHVDAHEDRRVEGMGVGFEEMLAKNGPEMRRQSLPTALRELRGKMTVLPHLKAFSVIPENGRRENPKGNRCHNPGMAIGWMADLGPGGARRQCGRFLRCWGKKNCPSKILSQQLVNAKQSFQMKVETVYYWQSSLKEWLKVVLQEEEMWVVRKARSMKRVTGWEGNAVS